MTKKRAADPRLLDGPTRLRDPSTLRVMGFGGEYEEPDRRRTNLDAQYRFCNAVLLHAPEVLEDLADEPRRLDRLAGRSPVLRGSICATCHRAAPPTEPYPARIVSPAFRVLMTHRYPEARALRRAIISWSYRWFNDRPEWLLEIAVATLASWSMDFKRFKSGERWWGGPEIEWLFDRLPGVPDVPFDLHLPGWDPRFELGPEADARIRHLFEEQLKVHLDGIVALAENAKLAKTREKRVDEHWEWLVLYQVKDGGWRSYRRIQTDQASKGRYRTEKSISDAIFGAAEDVGIRRRTAHRSGRPRKSPSTP